MVGRILRLAGFSLGLMLVAFSLPLYAQTTSDIEVAHQSEDHEASAVCKQAQTKINDYLTNLEQFKTTELDKNQSTLAFVSNISLRLEHNDQAEDNNLNDDVVQMNSLITEQEIAYTQLQSSLRTAVSVSCSSAADLDALRVNVSDIRTKIDQVNNLQSEFDSYVSDTVMNNLMEIQTQIDNVANGANT